MEHKDAVAVQIYMNMQSGDSLAEAIGDADIDFTRFNDPYWNNHPRVYRFETMVKTYIWGYLRGIRFRKRIADEISPRPNTRRELGYGTWDGTRRCPHQTTFNEAWICRFDDQAQEFIADVVEQVRDIARSTNTLVESEITIPEERDESEELTKKQIRRIVNQLVGYITRDYSFGREGPVSHEMNVFFQLLGHCALTSSSVHGGGDTFEWQKISEDDPPHGKTIMDLIKGLSKDEMLMMFQEAVDAIFEGLDDRVGLYDSPAPIAIDTVAIESDARWKRVTIESIANPEDDDWSNAKKRDTEEYIEEEEMECLVGEDPDNIRKADFDDPEKVEAAERISDVVRYVHGTKSGSDFMYAWEFAGAAVVHPTCPLMYAMEPLPKKDELEDHVERFIERGKELVDISEVYMDSAYSQVAGFQLFNHPSGLQTDDRFDLPYVMNAREIDDVQKSVLKEEGGKGTLSTKMEDNDNDVSIVPDYIQRTPEHGRGMTTLVALPKRDRENGGVVDVEDPVTDRVAFCTNREGITAENAPELLRGSPDDEHDRGYTNRWLIEIGFQKIKDFLAFTKSSNSDVRLFYTLYATLLFDVWMTVDRTIKKREHELNIDVGEDDEDEDGPDYSSEPRLSADVLSVIVANYLKPIT